MSCRLRDGCNIFTAEIEAINKAIGYAKFSGIEKVVILSDSILYHMSLKATRVRLLL